MCCRARLQRRLFTDHLPEPLRTMYVFDLVYLKCISVEAIISQDHGSSKDTAHMYVIFLEPEIFASSDCME